MLDLVGNPRYIFSHEAAHFIAGARASLLHLFDGTREIFDRTFVKTGNVDNAIKDFYAAQPTDVQTYYFPFGVSLVRSRAKDNTLPPTSNWSLFKLNFTDQEVIKLK